MRTRPHMLAMLAGLGALCVDPAGPERLFSNAPPRKRLTSVDADPRKPPMNGKREVARRLRHIQRGDVLNHPSVEAVELVFPR